MCYQCDPNKFNPNQCAQGFDPIPEGIQLQRMQPQVERLVLQAEKVGFLTSDNRHFRNLLSDTQEQLKVFKDQLERKTREVLYVREDLELVVKERDAALRKVPKKPKKVTKKAKK